MAVRMKAKFPGRCKDCNGWFKEGELIDWEKGAGARHAHHASGKSGAASTAKSPSSSSSRPPPPKREPPSRELLASIAAAKEHNASKAAPVAKQPLFNRSPEKWGTAGHVVTSEPLKINYGDMDDNDNFPGAKTVTKVVGHESPEGKIVDKRLVTKDGKRHVEYLHEQRPPEAQFEHIRNARLAAIDKTHANSMQTEMWGDEQFAKSNKTREALKAAKFGDDLPKLDGIHFDSGVEHLDTPKPPRAAAPAPLSRVAKFAGMNFKPKGPTQTGQRGGRFVLLQSGRKVYEH